MKQSAPQAIRLFTRSLVVFPEDVRRADQPVFMGHVHLDRCAGRRGHLQNFGTEQGDVVVLNNVVILGGHNFRKLPSFQVRSARLLGEERRQPSVTAAEGVYSNVRVRIELDLRWRGMQEVVGINTMHDVDLVSGIPQGVAEPVEVHGIPAKAVRGIEGREMQEIHRPHGLATKPRGASGRCQCALQSRLLRSGLKPIRSVRGSVTRSSIVIRVCVRRGRG